jgi:hypothetical protein
MFLAYLDTQDMNRPSQFVRALKSQMLGTDLKIENGWLTLGPQSNPMGAPEGAGKRLDRKLLGNLLRSIKQHGMLLIDVAADYAAQGDPALGRGESLAGLFVRLLWPDQGGALDQFDPTWLKLYGSMNPTQRRQLLAGEKVPLRQLTAQQRALVEAAVFGAEPYSMRYEPKGENQDWEVFHNGLRGEPTERYPHGLPPDAYLQVAEKREPVVFATGMHEGKYQMTTYLDVSNLAHHLFAQQNPQIYGGDYRGPEYTAFQPFDQRELEFAVRLDPEVSLMGQLHERRSIGKRVTSIDQLPADFLAKVQAARKTLEEQHKRAEPPPR